MRTHMVTLRLRTNSVKSSLVEWDTQGILPSETVFGLEVGPCLAFGNLDTMPMDGVVMAASATKSLSPEQEQELEDVFARARAALAIIETYDQARVDRLIQAVAWAVANRSTFHRLVEMGIEESGLGDFDSRMNKRMKIRGVLRDALRSPSVGRHRRRSREGAGQVRQAGRDHRLRRPDDEPRPHPCGQCHLCDQSA